MVTREKVGIQVRRLHDKHSSQHFPCMMAKDLCHSPEVNKSLNKHVAHNG